MTAVEQLDAARAGCRTALDVLRQIDLRRVDGSVLRQDAETTYAAVRRIAEANEKLTRLSRRLTRRVRRHRTEDEA